MRMRTSTLSVSFGLVFFAAQLSGGDLKAYGMDVTVRADATPPPASGPLVGLARLEVPGGQGIGGLSGLLWLETDELLLASDRGRVFRAVLERDDDGTLSGLVAWSPVDLPLPPGWSRDLEGLAVSDGDLLVSVEEPPHVIRFDGAVRAPLRVEGYLTWDDLGFRKNKGIEALTDLEGGGWLAIAETRGAEGHLVLTRDGRRFVYAAPVGFAPTAADRAGDRLFVLERRVSLFGGWQARLTCFEAASLDAAAMVVPEELARFGSEHEIDNMEALGVRRRGDDLEFLLVSDDNLSVLQRTLVLHYLWPGAASGGCRPGSHEPPEGEQERDRHAELGG